MKINNYLEELLQELPEKEYIGLGNPNAKILFIGKEAGADSEVEMFHGNVKSWKEKEFDYSKKYIPEETKIKNLNHTWQRYQKLYECILAELNIQFHKSDKYEISFVEKVFTTELSSLHAPNTIVAKKHTNFKRELEARKKNFFESKFIQQFQIIVIFASDKKYIETFSGEVCKLFNVKRKGVLDPDSKDKIWVHTEKEYSEVPKLLFHTRQLTNSIGKELIPSICNLVVEFIKDNSIRLDEI